MTKEEKEQEIQFLKAMIKSCLTYGYGLDNHYITQYHKTLGTDTVRKICQEQEKDFNERYEVLENTYTDSEGCTYNTLVEKIK